MRIAAASRSSPGLGGDEGARGEQVPDRQRREETRGVRRVEGHADVVHVERDDRPEGDERADRDRGHDRERRPRAGAAAGQAAVGEDDREREEAAEGEGDRHRREPRTQRQAGRRRPPDEELQLRQGDPVAEGAVEARRRQDEEPADAVRGAARDEDRAGDPVDGDEEDGGRVTDRERERDEDDRPGEQRGAGRQPVQAAARQPCRHPRHPHSVPLRRSGRCGGRSSSRRRPPAGACSWRGCPRGPRGPPRRSCRARSRRRRRASRRSRPAGPPGARRRR